MNLPAANSEAAAKDDECIVRAQKRALRAFLRLGSWRAVARELGINHSYLVLLNQGRAPGNPEIRVKLGLPRVLPSERKPRTRRVIPLLGSPCWMCLAFKKVRPRKWRKPL